MTNAEAAIILARRWDDIERAMQDWYGDREAVKEISDAFDCAIKLLQEHRQEQIVEARQIADQLAYAIMNYFSEPPKPAMQAWAARSWKPDVAST